MEKKTYKADVKATDTDGTFKALVSVFNNIDTVGDRVMPGAFARSLKERGLPPVIFSHQWHDLRAWIGQTTKAEETSRGLEVEGYLFLDTNDGAKIVHEAMKSGALKEFSFAFDIAEEKSVKEEDEEIRELHDLDLYEVGPTLVGANPATELISVRSLPERKGPIPFKDTTAAPEDAPWDAAAEIAKADADDLMAMCAWYDSAGRGEGGDLSKQAFKLAHHRADAGHPVVWRGVRGAMGSLLGTRGGVDIPESDRLKVWKHLAGHYEQFGKTAPEFREYDDAETKKLFHVVDERKRMIRAPRLPLVV